MIVTTKIAINGFGRIGRNVLRALEESGRDDLQVVAINDLSSTDNLAHLLKYDSVHGRFGGTVSHSEKSINIGKGDIQVTAIRSLEDQNWADNDVDIVMECTGIFTARTSAGMHRNFHSPHISRQTFSGRSKACAHFSSRRRC